jgi:aldehyde:ferredoxin oxidoreductase
MKMPFGHTGEILRIDLGTGQVSVQEFDERLSRRYLGGTGLIAYILLKEVPPGLDALDPRNRLIFALGPVSGAPLGGAGRNSVGAKSPLTSGFGKAEVGGHWGAEFRRTGYDGLVIEGRAEKPVYVWVSDEGTEIRDATHLWGQPTRETQEQIRQELGDERIRVAAIGPGGESQVRFACIINDLKDAAGRTGMGAVMGSKNLKAVAVRGTRAPEMADPEGVRSIARWLADNYRTLSASMHRFGTGAGMDGGRLTGNLPTRNFRDGDFVDVMDISAETIMERIGVGMDGCYACPIRCKKVVKVTEPYPVDPDYGGPEYETLAALGSNCGVHDPKAVARAHALCQAYSLDTISAGATIAFAMECFENGLLTIEDTDGIELRFGDAQAMLALVEKIARREGIGDLLAEGSRIAAQRIGRGADRYAVHVKGVEMGMHEPRLKQGLGLTYAVNPHGADHGSGIHDTGFDQEGPGLLAARTLGLLDPMPLDDLGPTKVRAAMYLQMWRNALDAIGLCLFMPYDHRQVVEIVRAITGWNASVWELMKAGERIAAMARVYNLREGLTAADDRLPERFFSPPTAGPLYEDGVAIDPQALEEAKHLYYQMMGWDGDTGVPCRWKLEELDIGWTAQHLP